MANNSDVKFQEILDYFGILVDQSDSVGAFTAGNTTIHQAYLLLNQGIQKVARQLTNFNENFYLDKFEVHTIAGVREYSMPSSLRNPKMVFIDYGGGNTAFKKCTAIDPKYFTDINNLDNDFDQEKPRWYLRGFRTIGLVPAPIVSTANTPYKPLKVWGLRLPEKIEAATSTVNIPREAMELVALYAASRVGNEKYTEEIRESLAELEDLIQPRGDDNDEIFKSDSIWDESFNSYGGYYIDGNSPN